MLAPTLFIGRLFDKSEFDATLQTGGCNSEKLWYNMGNARKGAIPVKYVNQKHYPHWLYVTRTELEGEEREKGKTTTMASSGCGLCSAVMVADRLLPNSTFGLKDALDLSYETKANHGIGTDYDRFAPAFAEKLGLRWESSTDFEDVRRCIHTGGAVVVLVKKGLFTNSLHWITIMGEEADGRFLILDPSLTDDKYEREDRKGRVELRNGVLLLCDRGNIVTEVPEDGTPYHLFWRA